MSGNDFLEITDSENRKSIINKPVKNVLCSGPGCLRLLTYLQSQNMICGVDSLEIRDVISIDRPYSLANKQFKTLSIFGEFRGHDNAELILSLETQPQIIFKTFSNSMGLNAEKLQNRTSIPVISLNYGDFIQKRKKFYNSLRLMASVIDKKQRAEEIIKFFENCIIDLNKRTSGITERPTVYLGGVAYKGPHGFQSTELLYPPFVLTNVKSLIDEIPSRNKKITNSVINKEKILEMDPDYIFLDLSTIQLNSHKGGINELKNDPIFNSLKAVEAGNVYGILPYNSYSINYGSIIANSYFIGKILYPENFKDIDPVKKSDEIYSFLVDSPVFNEMNKSFDNLIFSRIDLK